MPISSMIHAAETGDRASLALELSVLPATAPGRSDALEAATVGAATNGHAGCLLLLLEFGAPADSRLASTGLSALMGAVLSDELDCAAILTSAGADINAEDSKGLSALDHALKEQCNNSIWGLLRCGANPRKVSQNGTTPLMRVCALGDVELATYLVPLSDFSAVNNEGMNALGFAALLGKSPECLKALLPFASEFMVMDLREKINHHDCTLANIDILNKLLQEDIRRREAIAESVYIGLSAPAPSAAPARRVPHI